MVLVGLLSPLLHLLPERVKGKAGRTVRAAVLCRRMSAMPLTERRALDP